MRATRLITALRTTSLAKTPRLYPQYTGKIATRYKQFQTSALLQKTQTHILSDIGEGVKEVQIIQWFIEEGAAVEEWAPLCEVQSDKASVEITSKYTGVVKKLHFDRDAIVQVGDAMLDIEVEGDDADSQEADQEQEVVTQEGEQAQSTYEDKKTKDEAPKLTMKLPPDPDVDVLSSQSIGNSSSKSTGIATPAVRGLLKEHDLDIADIKGSGKDGRVLKEDIFRHIKGNKANESSMATEPHKPELDAKQTESKQNLTPIQTAMFKSMTKSLSIPHFLFSEKIDVTALGGMRKALNARRQHENNPKLTYLPFIIKAVSLAINQYPVLNARLDVSTDANRPSLMLRTNHNIGVAMDTPAGLIVPVIKNVNARSITSIAGELARLSELGQAGKLSNADLSGGTITVSNVGNIGGEVVAPVIVEGQLAILGVGKVKPTPVFADDGQTVIRADMMSTNWSADHRVIDGATMARAARLVQGYLEQPETMLIGMS